MLLLAWQAGVGGLSYQLLCWVTLGAEWHRGKTAESNLETIRSAGELVLQFSLFFFFFPPLWDSVTGKPDSNDPELVALALP